MFLVQLLLPTCDNEVEALDREWWEAFRRQLERDFRQETILARAIRLEPL
jgi:hypothetical protein